MEPRSLLYVKHACQATLARGKPDTLVERVCTDSRHIQAHDLFFALSGPQFDGHDFLMEVSRKKAAGVVVAPEKANPSDLSCAVLCVDDPRRALGRLAACYRAEFQVPTIAVAGSNGKTTTKNLLASVLSQQWRTVASEASFNNDIGVPLTLLRLEHQHQVAVLEAGTNHPGELAPLLRMIQPDIGIMTGLGEEHLEFFGDLDGVAQEEGWLPELLPAHGKLFINGDSPKLHVLQERCSAAVVLAGLGPQNTWRATHLAVSTVGTTFDLACPQPDFNGNYQIQLLGQNQVRNALLALAAGAELGLSPTQVRAGLAACPPARMRLELQEKRGVWILNDAYNANLDSMQTALETCQQLDCTGRRVAVLGDMAELGQHSATAHAKVGRLAAASGIHMLVAVGRWRNHVIAAAETAGLTDTHGFETVSDAAAFVQAWVSPGDLILLKASRAAGFEKFLDAWNQEN